MPTAFLAKLLTLWLCGAANAQTFTTLRSFSGSPDDGAYPYAGLTLSGSSLYGTAYDGGVSNYYGTLFKVNTDGTGYAVLKHFTGTDGGSPYAVPTLSGSVLYGTTYFGGSSNQGTVFKMNTDGTGHMVLKNFAGSDGASPAGPAGLTLSQGVLYGTTYSGGTSGYGTVFKLNTDGTGYTVLKHFTGGDGRNPFAGPTLYGGTLYGTTLQGGSNNLGTVFRVNPDGTAFTVLKHFTGSDGSLPYATSPTLSGSMLYGTTFGGGRSGQGTVFKMNPDGTGYTVLKHFSGSDGGYPFAGLTLSGNTLYGTTSEGGSSDSGTVFRVNIDGTGYTVLKHFSDDDGRSPFASLLLSGRTAYGTTFYGGSSGYGTVFKFQIPFTLTLLANGGGAITADPNLPGYASNAPVTLKAIANSGWMFDHWSGDASGVLNPLSVTMTNDKAITANFTATTSACVPAPADLVGWWPGGSNGNDVVSANNGYLSNGVAFAAGKVGQAFSFDGVDDYISIPHNIMLNAYPLTAAAWIKTTQTTNDAGLFNKYLASSLNGWQLYLWNGEVRAWYFRDGSSYIWDGDRGINGGPVNNGLWHLVVFTVDASGGKIYVDGVLKQSLAWTGTPGAPTTTQELRLGDHAGSVFVRYYQGLMDEPTIFNRALAGNEIQAIYNAGSNGLCLTPVYITSVYKSGSNLNLSWLAQHGVTYQVQSKTNLNAATPWAGVSGDVTATDVTASKTDVLPANAPQRFYRVQLLQ